MKSLLILSIRFYPLARTVEFERGTFELIRPRHTMTTVYFPRSASRRRLLRVLAGDTGECIWKWAQDSVWDEDGYWETACGDAFVFPTATPEGYTYCPNCGKKIKALERVDEEVDTA